MLTDAQRRALTIASRKRSMTTIGPRFRQLAATQVAPDTANRLIDRGFLVLKDGFLKTTPEGVAELNRPVIEPVVFLARRSQFGYTTKGSQGDHDAGAVLDEPSETWKKAAAEAEADAKLRDREARKGEATKLKRKASQHSGRHGWRTKRAA